MTVVSFQALSCAFARSDSDHPCTARRCDDAAATLEAVFTVDFDPARLAPWRDCICGNDLDTGTCDLGSAVLIMPSHVIGDYSMQNTNASSAGGSGTFPDDAVVGSNFSCPHVTGSSLSALGSNCL